MKMIAVDLDGTLLNSESKISKENIDAIKKAREHGIEVVVATGRASFDVQTIFEPTGIKTWIISANGAVIHDPEGTFTIRCRLIGNGQKEFFDGLKKITTIMRCSAMKQSSRRKTAASRLTLSWTA